MLMVRTGAASSRPAVAAEPMLNSAFSLLRDTPQARNATLFSSRKNGASG
jgi:hypothetical protein